MSEGSFVHVDLVSRDPNATRAFFEGAFGWAFPPGPFGDYRLWQAPAAPHGGLRPAEANEPPGIVGYLAVEDLEEARQRVVKAGGKVLGEVQSVPGFGRFFLFEAPGGIVEGAFEEEHPHEP